MHTAALLRFISFSLLGTRVFASLYERRNDAPQQTNPGVGVSTPSPPTPTDAARLLNMELRDILIPRQQGCESFSRGRATCGFLYNGEAVACFSTNHCVSSGRYLGCCSASGCDVTPGVYWTTCADYSVCASRTLSDRYMKCCSSIAHPFCVTGLSSATIGALSGSLITSFFCGNNRISGTQTLSATPSGWDATCTPTPSPSDSSSIISSTTTPTPIPPPATGTPTGAIAGGVVGGLAGLALIILAIWYAFRRGRRGAQQSQPEAPPPPQQPYTAPPNPSPQPYQPPMAYAPAPPMAPGPTQYATQYATQPAEPIYQQSPGSDLSTPYWPGSAGDGSIRKSPVGEQVVVTSVPTSPGSPGSAQAASFPSSPNPRASQFSSWTAPTAVGSPREAAHFVELGVERGDGELRELKA